MEPNANRYLFSNQRKNFDFIQCLEVEIVEKLKIPLSNSASHINPKTFQNQLKNRKQLTFLEIYWHSYWHSV